MFIFKYIYSGFIKCICLLLNCDKSKSRYLVGKSIDLIVRFILLLNELLTNSTANISVFWNSYHKLIKWCRYISTESYLIIAVRWWNYYLNIETFIERPDVFILLHYTMKNNSYDFSSNMAGFHSYRLLKWSKMGDHKLRCTIKHFEVMLLAFHLKASKK